MHLRRFTIGPIALSFVAPPIHAQSFRLHPSLELSGVRAMRPRSWGMFVEVAGVRVR